MGVTASEFRAKVCDLLERRGVLGRIVEPSFVTAFCHSQNISLRRARTREQSRAGLQAIDVARYFAKLAEDLSRTFLLVSYLHYYFNSPFNPFFFL